MKLPFQPCIISTIFFPSFNPPSRINYGNCFNWAYLAYYLFDKIELWSHETHAFIKYRNRFYDSETTQGCRDWRELRSIRDSSDMLYRRPAIRMSLNEFKKYWEQCNDCNWVELYNKVNKYISKKNKCLQ